jgi:hypothetical protein
LRADAVSSVFAGATQDFSVIAVVDQDTTTTQVAAAAGPSSGGNPLAVLYAGTPAFWVRDDGFAGTSIAASAARAAGERFIVSGVATETDRYVATNGAIVNSATSTLGSVTVDRFGVGALVRNVATNFYNGDLTELLVYNRALTASERRRVESYLARRWGITLAPQVSDADAQAWVNRVYAAGSTVSQPVANAVNTFVTGCKSDGIWDAMKSVVILAGADTLAGALAPLKGTAPTSYNFVSGDYSATSGLVGNGSTKYLDSNRAGNADPQDSSHVAVYGTTLTQSSQWVGSEGASVKNQGLSWYSPYLYFNNHGPNPGNQRVSTAFVSSGFAGTSRSGATDTAARYGGSDFTDATASATPSSENLAVFAYNDSGVITAHSASRLAFYSIGESLDLALLDARVSALMTDLGVS